MGVFGQLFGDRKLKDERGESANGQVYDPGGPLDLDKGVVHLAPPRKATQHEENEASDEDEG